MFNFYSLYSGSSGNCLFVQSSTTKILIDSGVSCKKIESTLNELKIKPESINAILITHEHQDHIKGLSTISKKFNIPVFATKETFENMPNQTLKIDEKNINTFNINDKFTIGDLKILPFSIPHDAAKPCGFNITNKNKTISIATDIGHMNNNILKNLEQSNFVLLESNYDTNVLKCCKYPFILKTRIASSTGHLSNDMAAKTISYLSKNGLKNAMLGHLSKESNLPELAYQTTLNELFLQNFDENNFNLNIASRDNPSKCINIE